VRKIQPRGGRYSIGPEGGYELTVMFSWPDNLESWDLVIGSIDYYDVYDVLY